MKLTERYNFIIKFPLFFIVFFFHMCSGVLKASDYLFHCKPWQNPMSEVLMEDNFSIKINNGSLTILGGDQNSKFANLIFTHPRFYLFASPSGSLININRNEGPVKVRYWEYHDDEDILYLSTCIQ